MFVKCGKYDCPFMGNLGYCSITACAYPRTIMNVEPEYERVEGICANTDWFPKTNADFVRSLSDEDLAWLIGENVDCCVCKSLQGDEECPCDGVIHCKDVWLKWLKQEHKDEKETMDDQN